MFRYTRYCVLALLVLMLQENLHAAKDLVGRRQERLKKADAPWSEPKIVINVHHRIPVYDSLGFLAANYDEPQKFEQLLVKVRPIATKVKTLSGGSLQGRSFPQSLDKELRNDRQVMFTAVREIYGASVLRELQSYLEKKQGAHSTGILGLIE